jgi:hypothetical protein
MRFAGLSIPQGVPIVDAWLQFTVEEVQSAATTLTIRAQAADNALPFSTASNNVAGRATTAAAVGWTPLAWATVGVAGPDQRATGLAAVIQEVVDRPGWQSGNALALLVTGSGQRTAESFDGSSAGAPLLHVVWEATTTATTTTTIVPPTTSTTTTTTTALPTTTTTTPATTTTTTTTAPPTTTTTTPATTTTTTTLPATDTTVVEARVSASADDAEQSVDTTSVSLTSGDLELGTDGSAQTVGMRFAGLSIPQGVPIVDAWLQFTVDEVQSEATASTIRAQAVDNAPPFSTASNNVAGRTTTAASAGWTPLPWATVGVAGPDQRATGLAAVIQEVVDRPGWQPGNALALLFAGSGRRTAESFDGSSSGAPLLHVVWDGTGYDFPPQVTITAPGDHAMFTAGTPVSFSASANDPEQGNVSASLSWYSSRNGPIGSGPSFTTSSLMTGVHTITVTASDTAGQTGSTTFQLEIASGRFVLVGAGDISKCTNDHDGETSALLDQTFGTVFTVGDNVYPSGTVAEFETCYGPTWGRHKARTRPSLGNHDLDTPNGAGYFGYFGSAAGPAPEGYYSFDADAWHVIVLNAECSHLPGGCTRSSPQGQWLAADLAAHPNLCTAAIMHRPRGSDTLDLWQLLYEAGADLVLAGHQHHYERFDPQTPTGDADPSRGIRQFIVGTGGAGLSSLGPPHATSAARDGSSYGVLKLTLYPSSYDWQFLPAAGYTFTDSGTASCVAAGP